MEPKPINKISSCLCSCPNHPSKGILNGRSVTPSPEKTLPCKVDLNYLTFTNAKDTIHFILNGDISPHIQDFLDSEKNETPISRNIKNEIMLFNEGNEILEYPARGDYLSLKLSGLANKFVLNIPYLELYESSQEECILYFLGQNRSLLIALTIAIYQYPEKSFNEYSNSKFINQIKESFPKDIASLLDLAYHYLSFTKLLKDHYLFVGVIKKGNEMNPFYKALFCGLAYTLFFPQSSEGHLLLGRLYFILSTESQNKQLRKLFLNKALLYATKGEDWESLNLQSKIYLQMEETQKLFTSYSKFLATLPLEKQFPIKTLLVLFHFSQILDHKTHYLKEAINAYELAEGRMLLDFNGFAHLFFLKIQLAICEGNFIQAALMLNQSSPLFPGVKIFKILEMLLLFKEEKFDQMTKFLTGSDIRQYPTGFWKYLESAMAEKRGNFLNAYRLLEEAIHLEEKILHSENILPLLCIRNSWHLKKCHLLVKLNDKTLFLESNLEASFSRLQKHLNGDLEFLRLQIEYYLHTDLDRAFSLGLKYHEQNPLPISLATKWVTTFSKKHPQISLDILRRSYLAALQVEKTFDDEDFNFIYLLLAMKLKKEAEDYFEKFAKNLKGKQVDLLKVEMLILQSRFNEAFSLIIQNKEKYPDCLLTDLKYAQVSLELNRPQDAFERATKVYDKAKDPEWKRKALEIRLKIRLKQPLQPGKIIADFETLQKFGEANFSGEIHLAIASCYIQIGKPNKAREMKKRFSDIADQIEALLKSPTKVSQEHPESTKQEIIPQASLSVVVVAQKSDPLPEWKPPQEESVKEARVREKKIKEHKWIDPKVKQLKASFKMSTEEKINYYTEIAGKNRCLLDPEMYPIHAVLPKHEPLPSPVAAASQTIVAVKYQKSPLDEILRDLRIRKPHLDFPKDQAKTPGLLHQLNDVEVDRLTLAKNSLEAMATHLEFYKNGLDQPLPQYLLSRNLMYRILKFGEALHPTSELHKPGKEFAEIVTLWCLDTEIPHRLRNQVRHQFHQISLEKTVECCKILLESTILTNLQGVLSYQKTQIESDLKLNPRTEIPTLSLLANDKKELTPDVALKEIDQLASIFEKLEYNIVNQPSYFEAAKMSICIIAKCLPLIPFSSESKWIKYFGRQYAHGIGDGLQWGHIEEVSPQFVLLILGNLEGIKQDFRRVALT